MKNNQVKTKTVMIILTTIMLSLAIVSPFTPSNVNAVPSSHTPPTVPILSSVDKQGAINAALSIPELKNWSQDWQFSSMGLINSNNSPEKVQQEVVVLKAPSKSAPFACNADWWAWIEIDNATKKVVYANYPTMESHVCQHTSAKKSSDPHTWTIATQNDVNSTTQWFGIYAKINLPTVSNSIYTHLNNQYIEQLVNAYFPHGTGCSNSQCIEQAGWQVTQGSITCIGCPSGASNTMIYVDESVHGTENNYWTGLLWKQGTTTIETGEIDCLVSPSVYTIIAYNGTNNFYETTNIPCSTAQWDTSPPLNGVENNSVFFESAVTIASSNWSPYISGVSVTGAQEYDSGNHAHNLSTSHNVDRTCGFVDSKSSVITGSLTSGGTASWSSLSNQPAAC